MIRTVKYSKWGSYSETTIRVFGHLIFAIVFGDHRSWFRIWPGYGLHWKDNTVEPLFSERMKLTRVVRIGRYRFKILKP